MNDIDAAAPALGPIATPTAKPARHEPTPKASDTLGCLADRLHEDRELVGAGVTFHRKRSKGDYRGQVATPATDRGVLVGVAQGAGHRRRVFHEHHATSHEFDADTVYVRNFADAYRADMQGPLDFLLVEVSPAALEHAIEEAGGARVGGLAAVTARHDPQLSSLVKVVVPALDRPGEASTLFIDQLAIAIATRLALNYGGAPAEPRQRHRVLSRANESRAKDMLRSHLDGDISIAAVADACHLSRSHFTLAFRETTGQTPHQWLMAQRVERARELLQRSRMSLAEVASVCGFADQSHFTRVFARAMGMPPGTWRRRT